MLDGPKGKGCHPEIKLGEDFLSLDRSDNRLKKIGKRDSHQRHSKGNQHEP